MEVTNCLKNSTQYEVLLFSKTKAGSVGYFLHLASGNYNFSQLNPSCTPWNANMTNHGCVTFASTFYATIPHSFVPLCVYIIRFFVHQPGYEKQVNQRQKLHD